MKVPLPPVEGFLGLVIHLLHGEFLPLDLLLHELVHSNVATGLLKELFVQDNHTFSRCLLHDHTIEAGDLVQIEQRLGAGIGVADKDHPRKSISGVLIGQRVDSLCQRCQRGAHFRSGVPVLLLSLPPEIMGQQRCPNDSGGYINKCTEVTEWQL